MTPDEPTADSRLPGGKPFRVAPAALTAASIALLVATFVAGPAGEWAYVLLTPLFPVLLILLAVERRGFSPRLLKASVVGLGILLVGSSVAIRVLDAQVEQRWVLGLPLSAIVMGLGLVLLPLILVGFGFAATVETPPGERGTGASVRER